LLTLEKLYVNIVKKAAKTILKILVGIVSSIIFLLVVIVVLIRIPFVQTYITHKAVSYISGKTHTKTEIGKLYIIFPKSIVIESLFAEDERHDTLLSINKLEVDINLLGLARSKVEVNGILLSGVNANIKRNDLGKFNFDFLINAFTNKNKKQTKQEAKTEVKKTGKPWQITVKKVELENIRYSYDDRASGFAISGYVGSLKALMKSIDIVHLDFNGDELALHNVNTRIILSQAHLIKPPDTSTSAPARLPGIEMNKVSLDSVTFYMDNKGVQQYAINVGKLTVFPDTIDLNSRKIKIKSADLSKSNGAITLTKSTDTTKTPVTASASIDTPGSGWTIEGGKVKISEVNFSLDMNGTPHLADALDFNHLHLTGINIAVNAVHYSPERITGDIKNVSVKDQSGLNVHSLQASVLYDDHHIALHDLSLITDQTQVSRSIVLSYPSLSSLSKNIGMLGIAADLRNTKVAVHDLLLLVPSLRSAPQLAAQISKAISISGRISGRLGDLTAQGLVVQAAQETSVSLDGHIKGLPDALHASYDVDIKKIHTTQQDINTLAAGRLPASIAIPASLDLSGQVRGSLKDLAAQLSLVTSSGNADVDVTLKQVNGDTLYTVALRTQALDIGYILRQKKLLGMVTMSAALKGKNIALSNMTADMDGTIASMVLNKYDYHNISLTATADHDKYNITLTSKDPNLAMDLQSDISMVKDQKSLSLDLNIECADLRKLGLVKYDMSTNGQVQAYLHGRDMETFYGDVRFGNIVLFKDEHPYFIDSALITASKDTDYTNITITSPLANASVDGSVNIGDLKGALEHQISRYFSKVDDENMVLQDTARENFKLIVDILPNPIIKGAILPDLENFNGIDVKADFDNGTHKLNLAVSAPQFGYTGYNADTLRVDVYADSSQMKYGLSFLRLKNKSINVAQTTLNGTVKDSTVFFALNIEDIDSGDKLTIGGDVSQDRSKSFVLHLDNKNLVIDNKKWGLPEDNAVHYSPDGLFIHDLILSYGGQSLDVHSKTDTANAPLEVSFKDFHLGTISSIAEKDSALVRGVVNGSAELQNVLRAPGFTSDIRIDNIFYKDNSVGNLTLKADNLSPNKYSAAVTLTGDDNDLAIKGFYSPDTIASHINLDVQIRKLNFTSVQGFTYGQIRRSKGYMSGAVTVDGTFSKPIVNGTVNFKDAGFNVAYINNYLQLKDASIKVDPQGIYFNSFNIEDSIGHKAVVDGKILTSDFRKMKFDLAIKTDKFMVLNTTVTDNPLYYGHVVLTSDITIKGDNLMPVISTNAKLVGGSSVTVVVPPSKISADRGEGVVVLVDTTEGDVAIKSDSIVDAGAFRGIALSANLDVTKETTFKVIVDKTSGDSLVVRGDGLLSFSMDATGKQSLTGTYTLDGGGYRASFQKIIKKEFTIKQGSTIMFNGSPTDATVDITAVYSTRAAAINLFSAELANASSEEKNAYNALLNFDVDLMMKGELLNPVITFAIDMADKDKDAFNGSVYAKLGAMNKDPAILNQQVFALLVLNTFMSTDILAGGGSPGGTSDAVNSFARNSVNQVLTDQLNALSGKYIKGVDLNFGVQSNDQYSSNSTAVQQNTQLSVGLKKQFFNNRLSVEVGTSITVQNNNGALTQTNANTLTGDIAVEYKLTKDGRYSFKAFRENLYDDVIDGLIYKTGIGLVYTKNYDTIKELFTPVKKDKDAKPAAKN
jgi:translocation and assembly module TamB